MPTLTLVEKITAALTAVDDLPNLPGVTFDAEKHELIGTLSRPEQHLHQLALSLSAQTRAAHESYMAAPNDSAEELIYRNAMERAAGQHTVVQTLLGASVTERLALYATDFSGIVVLADNHIGGIISNAHAAVEQIKALFGGRMVLTAVALPRNQRGRPH